MIPLCALPIHLDIPLATICNENPYNEEDKSLPEVGKLVGMSDQRSKKAYLSNRTSAIFTKFDYSDLPKVDQLIADFFVLDDMTREELFEYITLLKKNHSDPERVKILKEIKKLLGYKKTGSTCIQGQGFPLFSILLWFIKILLLQNEIILNYDSSLDITRFPFSSTWAFPQYLKKCVPYSFFSKQS